MSLTNSAGKTPLHASIDHNNYGDASIVLALIAAGADVNVADFWGQTPLHDAAFLGHALVVSALLAAGADVNAKNNSGETPLIYADNGGDDAIVAALIAAGGHWGEACADASVVNPAGPFPPCACESPNVETGAGVCEVAAACAAPSVWNAKTNLCDCPAPNIGADGAEAPGDCRGENALLDAAGAGDLDSVSYLIAVHMADVNVKDDDGATPLHHSAENGHVSVVATLLAAGATVNVKDNDGATPLHHAAENGRAAVVSMLLAAGADVTATTNGGETPLNFAVDSAVVSALIAAGGHRGTACADGNVVNPAGNDPSCVAAAACALPSVWNAGTNLCDCPAPNVGADGAAAPGDCQPASAEVCEGLTPPQFYSATLSACVAIAECAAPSVLDAEANRCDCPAPNIGADGAKTPGDCHAKNALLDAAEAGDLDLVAHLITVHMADVNVKSGHGATPLHAAARGGHASIVATLLAAGADADAKNNGGHAPLHAAARYDRAAAVAALIAGGADVNVKNNNDETPLIYAAISGHAAIVSALLAAGADVNAEKNGGHAPLHYAANHGHLSVVSALLAEGADVNAKNNNDETPLHYAADNGRAAVVAALLAAGADVNARNNGGHAPLHRAVVNSGLSVVATLLAEGADVNAKNNGGETPLRVTPAWRAESAALLIARGGHWGTVCTDGNVVNPSGHSPPCVCESPKVQTNLGACEVVAACALPSVWNAGTNRCDCPGAEYRGGRGGPAGALPRRRRPAGSRQGGRLGFGELLDYSPYGGCGCERRRRRDAAAPCRRKRPCFRCCHAACGGGGCDCERQRR